MPLDNRTYISAAQGASALRGEQKIRARLRLVPRTGRAWLPRRTLERVFRSDSDQTVVPLSLYISTGAEGLSAGTVDCCREHE